MARRSKVGFSLVELLVVIAIIAIIAGLLLPVFVSAKRSGKLSADLQSIRQLGMSISIYCGDANDILPPAVSDVRYLDGIQNGWNDIDGLAKTPWAPLGELLYPYTQNKQIFLRIEDKPEVLMNWPPSIPRSDYVFDELSGLRSKSLSSMPATGTMLLGGVSRGKEKFVNTPCLSYDMKAQMTPYGDCDSKTAWLSDF